MSVASGISPLNHRSKVLNYLHHVYRIILLLSFMGTHIFQYVQCYMLFKQKRYVDMGGISQIILLWVPILAKGWTGMKLERNGFLERVQHLVDSILNDGDEEISIVAKKMIKFYNKVTLFYFIIGGCVGFQMVFVPLLRETLSPEKYGNLPINGTAYWKAIPAEVYYHIL